MIYWQITKNNYKVIGMDDYKIRLSEFIEQEARSCSMDFGCVTPLYVYRMWGGSVAIDGIATGLTELRKYNIVS